MEGVVATASAIAAGSVALLGFGIDSFVEVASAGILVWRLRAESHPRCPPRSNSSTGRARRLVGMSLFGLAGFILLDAARSLWTRERPEVSVIGIAITALSIGVMMWLSKAKRRAAIASEAARSNPTHSRPPRAGGCRSSPSPVFF